MMRKLLLIVTILFSLVSDGQTPLHKLIRKKVTTSSVIEARVHFSLGAYSVSTYNNLTGNPHSSIRSMSLNDITGAATGWSITTIATANWGQFSGTTATDGIAGVTGGTFLDGATIVVYQNSMFNYGTTSPATYDAAKPQLRITGLDISKDYTVKITGCDGTYTFDCTNMRYTIVGATSPASQDVGGDVTNVTNGATFTLKPDGSGQLTIWCNSISGSSELNMIAGLTITQL